MWVFMAATSRVGKLGIVARLFPQGSTIAREVELAERDPMAYVRRFAQRLDDRDIPKPVRQLPWIALVDALIAARAA